MKITIFFKYLLKLLLINRVTITVVFSSLLYQGCSTATGLQQLKQQNLAVNTKLEELEQSSAQLKSAEQSKVTFLSTTLDTGYFINENAHSIITKLIQTNPDWKFKNVSSKDLNEIYLTVVFDEEKSRTQIINIISKEMNLNANFYPKLKLVVLSNIE